MAAARRAAQRRAGVARCGAAGREHARLEGWMMRSLCRGPRCGMPPASAVAAAPRGAWQPRLQHASPRLLRTFLACYALLHGLFVRGATVHLVSRWSLAMLGLFIFLRTTPATCMHGGAFGVSPDLCTPGCRTCSYWRWAAFRVHRWESAKPGGGGVPRCHACQCALCNSVCVGRDERRPIACLTPHPATAVALVQHTRHAFAAPPGLLRTVGGRETEVLRPRA